MTIRTSGSAAGELGQIRGGLQTRDRGGMTGCTGIVMNRYHNLAAMNTDTNGRCYRKNPEENVEDAEYCYSKNHMLFQPFPYGPLLSGRE